MTSAKVSEIIIENGLHFLTEYNIPIIHGLTLFCGFLLLTWWVRAFKGQEASTGESSLSTNNFAALEKTIKTLLETAPALQAANLSAAPGAATGTSTSGASENSGGESGSVPSDSVGTAQNDGESVKIIEQLNSDVSSKEAEIVSLKDQLAKSSTEDSAGGGASEELQKKLEELEGKLLEYEIIEDDIADLSLYKEENAKLKDELERVKASGGGGAPAPEPQATSEPEPEAAAEPEFSSKALEEEAAGLAEEVTPAEATTETPPAEEALVEEPPAEETSSELDDLAAEMLGGQDSAPAVSEAAEGEAQKLSPLITDDLVSEFKKAMDSPDAEDEMEMDLEVANTDPDSTAEAEVPEVKAMEPTENVSEETPTVEEAPALAEVPVGAEAVAEATVASADVKKPVSEAPTEIAQGPMEAMEEDDILAEFTNEAGETEPITKAVVTNIADAMTAEAPAEGDGATSGKDPAEKDELSDIDTDKMLAEMDSLGGLEEKNDGFSEEFDVDKMAEEAQKLASNE